MKKLLLQKLREALFSVGPIVLLVLCVNLTPLVDLSGYETAVFCVCGVLLVLGIALFNLGADMAMTPMGTYVGSGLTRSGKLALLLPVCFLLGALVTVAEPDLSVLASQVAELIDGTLLVALIGVGVGLFLLVAVVKIVFRVPLSSLLLFFYFVLFALTSLVVLCGDASFLPLAFDSGGVTTGPITVPFLMALGVGIASRLGGRNVEENSFGLVALCSVGPIIAVMAVGLFGSGDVSYTLPDYSLAPSLPQTLLSTVLTVLKDVGLALGLMVAAFVVLQLTVLKLPRVKLKKIAVGLLFTFCGLVLFLTAVSVGFMPVGYKMGEELSAHREVMYGFAFVLGALTVLAEPAVHVLNRQVEEVTEGRVSKRSMTVALSVGVGAALLLSVVRTAFHFSVLYYLVPGYLLSLGLSFFVPGLYTAIAFDSGGVASGPLTSGFVLPFGIGVCVALQGAENVLTDAFGIVALVAMTPLITIQLLGFRSIVVSQVRETAQMKRILSADDDQIITFL